jgi:CheY-specific phosphatase CheX
MRINNGTAINWSFSMVEFVFNVISNVVNLKLEPQIPKTKARNISVNEIGKPIKITKIIAASIIRPIVGFESPGRDDIKSVKASPPGIMSGRKTAITNQTRAIK